MASFGQEQPFNHSGLEFTLDWDVTYVYAPLGRARFAPQRSRGGPATSFFLSNADTRRHVGKR